MIFSLIFVLRKIWYFRQSRKIQNIWYLHWAFFRKCCFSCSNPLMIFLKTDGKTAKHSYLSPRQSRDLFWLSSKANIVKLSLHQEGWFALKKAILILSNQHWLRSWYYSWEDPLNLTVIAATCIWALLVDALCWNFLVG